MIHIQQAGDVFVNNINFFNIYDVQNDIVSYKIKYSLFFIYQSQNVIIDNFLIENCNFLQNIQGGISIENVVSADIKNGKFINNNSAKGMVGGILVINIEQLQIKNTQFIKNTQEIYGSISCSISFYVYITDCDFEENTILNSHGTVINLQRGYQNNILNNNIINNYSHQSGGGVWASQIYQLIVSGNKIQKNYAFYYAGAIFYDTITNLSLDHNIFENNIATRIGGSIFFMNIREIKIEYDEYIQNYTPMSGGSILLQQCNKTEIISTKFNNNWAEDWGGALSALSCLEILLQNCFFLNNYSGYSGGAIMSNNGLNIIIKNNLFQLNSALISGGALDLWINEQNVLESNVFINNFAPYGGAVYGLHSDILKSFNNTFIGNIADEGGCYKIQFWQSLLFQNDSFIKNTSNGYGGMMYAQSIESITFLFSEISNNNGSHKGGGLYLQDLKDFVLNHTKIQGNYLKNVKNFVEIGGGAYLKDINTIQICNSLIQHNYSCLLGGGLYFIGSIQILIQDSLFVNNTVYYEEVSSLEQKEANQVLSKGGAIFLEISEDQRDQMELRILNNQFSQNKASSGTSIFILQENNAKLLDLKNFCNISISQDIGDVGLIRYLGEKFEDEILKKIQITDVFDNNLIVNDQKLVVVGYLTNELKLSEKSLLFELCQQGSFLENGGQNQCGKCHEAGVCPGGYKLNYPQKGYWRESVSEFNYIKCDKEIDSCLGKDECKQGYEGVLCQSCNYEQLYKRTLQGKCENFEINLNDDNNNNKNEMITETSILNEDENCYCVFDGSFRKQISNQVQKQENQKSLVNEVLETEQTKIEEVQFQVHQ
ncbi:Pectin lyase fold/virulence factor [Pseudocohnilembus persalinus]|uniref:Pectin lyase fold/virulence factor n=1 Tax=Pseudocohnilembus persalinus TaxID=266149 RepID=A0A0V0QFD6_PSEPJ|nr:Pectin lyase fold/virulence factor [Pseudocohnilembus persalinus]|eukprot:KRX00832.1 Pectin lyase fold/virulence factor [Pseudocohnilembus persalinus]